MPGVFPQVAIYGRNCALGQRLPDAVKAERKAPDIAQTSASRLGESWRGDAAGVAVGAPLARLAALMMRERKTRFSGGAISSLWAYLTPIGWLILVVLAFGFLGRTVPIDASVPLFVASGILPYATFRQVISSMMRTVIANRYLVYFQPVCSAEIALASALLELLTMFVVAAVILIGVSLAGDTGTPADLLGVCVGIALAWALGTGIGRFAAALGQWSDTLSRVIPMLLRPLFWLSGVFFTASELPGQAQALFWFNPLFHAIETLREGMFLDYRSPIATAWYPLAVASAFWLAASPVERLVRRKNLARQKP